MNVSSSQPSGSKATTSSTQEFSIRVPKNRKKKFNIMRFNSNLNVDFSGWKQIKMERENNRGEKHANEEMPKYGAGSEFRREEKEDARKKKFGYTSKSYNPDNQPWILKSGGKNGKKFRGIREGGVGDNAAYYVFHPSNDGSMEAYPVSEWYNFHPVQRFKALSAEEAEEEFGKRNRSLNYFSLMMRKKFRKDDEDEMDEEGGTKKNKGRDFKISDFDDWVDSDDDDDNDSEGDDAEKKENKKKKKKETAKKKAIQKKKKTNTDESAGEESDDGDEEGRELDYISDSSESCSDHEAKLDKEMKGVSDESALRKLLTSDEEEEDDEEAKKSSEEGDENKQEEPPAVEEPPQTSSQVNKKKRKKEPAPARTKAKSNNGPSKNEDTFSDFSPDSSDSDEGKAKKSDASFDLNQISLNDSLNGSESLAKKPRLETPSEPGISEEAVRRYLARKPMTTAELAQKFKKPRTNLNSDQLVRVISQILKKINPDKRMIKNKMYLSLKPENAKPKL